MNFSFSSRRRHTRCLSDWSSDVCSSDLLGAFISRGRYDIGWYVGSFFDFLTSIFVLLILISQIILQIGRASCRERVYFLVVGEELNRTIDSRRVLAGAEESRDVGASAAY